MDGHGGTNGGALRRRLNNTLGEGVGDTFSPRGLLRLPFRPAQPDATPLPRYEWHPQATDSPVSPAGLVPPGAAAVLLDLPAAAGTDESEIPAMASLTPHGGRPLLHTQVARLVRAGFRRLLLVVADGPGVATVRRQAALARAARPGLTLEVLALAPPRPETVAGFPSSSALLEGVAGHLGPLQQVWVQAMSSLFEFSPAWFRGERALRVRGLAMPRSSRAPAPAANAGEVVRKVVRLGPLLGTWSGGTPGSSSPEHPLTTLAAAEPDGGAESGCREDTVAAWHTLDQTPGDAGSEARTDTVDARSFNQLEVFPADGYVVKRSRHDSKMAAEIAFYQQLPAPFRLHFPRLLEVVDDGDLQGYSLEFFPLRSLSQQLVFDALPPARWHGVLDHLLGLHARFRAWGAGRTLPAEELFAFYWNKTLARLTTAREAPALQRLLAAPDIVLNGRRMAGWPRLEPLVCAHLRRACDGVTEGFVHGDLCFSNILFDPGSTMVRLIDPRGEFMGSVNLGDPRYDLAKLLHSAHGRYDFILHDLFEAGPAGLPDHYRLHVPGSPGAGAVAEMLFARLDGTPYRREDLVLLEALLFLSMLPLHADAPHRQMAFALTGLGLLDTLFGAGHAATAAMHPYPATQSPTENAFAHAHLY